MHTYVPSSEAASRRYKSSPPPVISRIPIRSPNQMTQPPPSGLITAKARQEQFCKHQSLHSSKLLLLSELFDVSGSFSWGTFTNPSPLPQSRGTLREQPPVQSRRAHCSGDRGSNPLKQLHALEASFRQTPYLPQVAYVSHESIRYCK